jgi:hypothetical protein
MDGGMGVPYSSSFVVSDRYGMVYRYGRGVLSNPLIISPRGGCSHFYFFLVARSVVGIFGCAGLQA